MYLEIIINTPSVINDAVFQNSSTRETVQFQKTNVGLVRDKRTHDAKRLLRKIYYFDMYENIKIKWVPRYMISNLNSGRFRSYLMCTFFQRVHIIQLKVLRKNVQNERSPLPLPRICHRTREKLTIFPGYRWTYFRNDFFFAFSITLFQKNTYYLPMFMYINLYIYIIYIYTYLYE